MDPPLDPVAFAECFAAVVVAVGLTLAFALHARDTRRRLDALERQDRERQRIQTRHAASLARYTLAVVAVERRVSDVGAEVDSQRRPAIPPRPPRR